MMLGDSTPSRLYTASCFEDNDHTEDITGDNMKQPLIIMSNESLRDEEQTTVSKERPSRSILCIQSFLFGSFIAFAVQGIAFAACDLVKMFGKEPPKPPAPPGSLLLGSFPYYYFVRASQLEAVIFVIVVAVWMTSIYTITKSGSLYIRKKFDKKDAPASNHPRSGSSISWTKRILFFAGLYFAVGSLVGSTSLWMLMFFLRSGMVLPWPPVFSTVMIGWVFFLITLECFEWRSRSWHQTTEDEPDDDSCFLV
jgi:hypothetical protein